MYNSLVVVTRRFTTRWGLPFMFVALEALMNTFVISPKDPISRSI